MRTANGWVASRTRSASRRPRKSASVSSVKPRASTWTPAVAPNRLAHASSRVTVARTRKPAATSARASTGPSDVPLRSRTVFCTAALPEEMAVGPIIQPGPVPAPGDRRPDEDERGPIEFVLAQLLRKAVESRHDDLLVRPRHAVGQGERRL